jgi:uncharacterized membrane protein
MKKPDIFLAAWGAVSVAVTLITAIRVLGMAILGVALAAIGVITVYTLGTLGADRRSAGRRLISLHREHRSGGGQPDSLNND